MFPESSLKVLCMGPAVFPKFHYFDSSSTEKYTVLMFKALDVITLTGIFFSPPNNTLEVLNVP
jgi:hypothetical protein